MLISSLGFLIIPSTSPEAVFVLTAEGRGGVLGLCPDLYTWATSVNTLDRAMENQTGVNLVRPNPSSFIPFC